MENVEIIDGAQPSEVAEYVNDHIARELGSTIRDAGDLALAITVPGGSTPFPIFEAMVKHPLEWSRVIVWPNDDRLVPEYHAASNTGKLRAIFEPVSTQVVALPDADVPPHFALTWLGMGGDGHIASLFPNTDPQVDADERVKRLTPDPLPPEAPFDRITLTIPALLNTQRLLFTLGGSADKHAVFDGAMSGEHNLPIARLLRAANERGIKVTCFA